MEDARADAADASRRLDELIQLVGGDLISLRAAICDADGLVAGELSLAAVLRLVPERDYDGPMEPDDDLNVERITPAEAADFLDRRPMTYARQLVLSDGTRVDLNEPGPLSAPETSAPSARRGTR